LFASSAVWNPSPVEKVHIPGLMAGVELLAYEELIVIVSDQ
jgi:hypothetical protein